MILKRLNFSYKRIRKRGKSNKKEELKQIFLSKIKELNDQTIISIDESGFDHHAFPIYGYSLKGKRAILTYKPSNDRKHHSLLMAISSKGGKHYQITSERVNSIAFVDFIKSLPLRPNTILLMDNASIHKSKALKDYLDYIRCSIIFTPPYSPEYNPIELIFGIIKNKYYKLRYKDNFNIIKSINESISSVTADHIMNSFNHVLGKINTT